MSVKCSRIVDFIEQIAPPYLAEDWDNVGLLVGSKEKIIRKAMVCLDVTSEVVDEALQKKVDLIISHHPFIFKGIKRINGDDQKSEAILKVIRGGISVYSAHTNLDIAEGGVNDSLAELLELTDITNLNVQKEERLYKLVVFVPEESLEQVRDAVSRAGAGFIGNYSDCTYTTKGLGTYRPLEGTNPYKGEYGKLEEVTEYRMETVVPEGIMKKVISEMIEVHPYEEVAYDIYPLKLSGRQYGIGRVGTLRSPKKFDEFINLVKKKLNLQSIRVIGTVENDVRKVAVFSGSFDGDLYGLKRCKADVLITGDIKYHTAMEAIENKVCILDVGHFESERVVIPKLIEKLSEKFPEICIESSSVEKSPFKIS